MKTASQPSAAANTFSNTVVKVEGGTLHMGGVSSSAKARMAAMPTANTVTGAGSAASYATSLKGLHMADGTTLSLDMNVAGNADIPYFTLANGRRSTASAPTAASLVLTHSWAKARSAWAASSLWDTARSKAY